MKRNAVTRAVVRAVTDRERDRLAGERLKAIEVVRRSQQPTTRWWAERFLEALNLLEAK